VLFITITKGQQASKEGKKDHGGQTRLRLEFHCSVDRSKFASAHLRSFFVPGRELCGAIKKMGSLGACIAFA
jgi:hypothetical protein